MYSTQVYVFQQIARVLMLESGDGETFPYRYDPVYAKKLTINKGVDNVLLFQFINQEEKPFDITGSTLTFRAISQDGARLLIEENMVILNPQLGRAKVTLKQQDLLDIQSQPASYSISRQSGVLYEAVFTNAQAGARAPVDIVNSVVPAFIPSVPLTIPTLEITNEAQPGGSGFEGNWWNGQGWGTGATYYNSLANTEYFSSFIEPRAPITTIQMDLVGYTGTIKVQGAQNYQSIWYNVTDSVTYYNSYETIYLNVIGWHPILRLAFNNSVFATPAPVGPGWPASAAAFCMNGQVTSISVLNGGKGYLAPPRVDIFGNGAGATAEATIDAQGTVTGITVTNPGAGYWPVPIQGYINNAQQSPVPADEQGAIVSITTGYSLNHFYR
jgi:hypothetical protein